MERDNNNFSYGVAHNDILLFIASLIITLKVREVVDNNSGNVSEDMKRSLYSLYDDSGQLRLSVKVEDIVMFKSERIFFIVKFVKQIRADNSDRINLRKK